MTFPELRFVLRLNDMARSNMNDEYSILKKPTVCCRKWLRGICYTLGYSMNSSYDVRQGNRMLEVYCYFLNVGDNSCCLGFEIHFHSTLAGL